MIIDNEDFEIKKSNYYWAGRLMFLPKEKAWQIADEVAEVIDYAQNKALTAPVDTEEKELPEFLMKNLEGKIVTCFHGGSDVTEDWNNYLSQTKTT